MSCVFWDPEYKVWSNEGCEIRSRSKNQTVCECNHLTNFGLLFGGNKTEQDRIKSNLSNILGGISIAFLMFTQIALHMNFGK